MSDAVSDFSNLDQAVMSSPSPAATQATFAVGDERTASRIVDAITESYPDPDMAIAAFEAPGGRWDVTMHFAEPPDRDLIHTLVSGAAAKGATLVNFFGIGSDLVDFVVDRSTYKQGRYMPGARIPILPPSALVEKKPDYCLLLAWNFADEILAQQKEYRDAGGKFIVPIPNVRVA